MITTSHRVRLRATALALGSTATLAALLAAFAPTTDLDPGQPFAELLGQWCTVVLLGCAAWAWVVTIVVLLEAVRATADGAAAPPVPVADRRRGLPTAYRRLVLGACGLALTAGAASPALATPGPVHLVPPAPVAHVRVPAIVPSTTPAPRPAQGSGDIVVRPGDSLWRLAAERLPEDADNATIAHTWRRLYDANTNVIGPDPDHLEPGQQLVRPRVW